MSTQFVWAASPAPLRKVNCVQFGILNPTEIETMGVFELLSSETIDVDGQPRKDGLLDPRFGPPDRKTPCETCNSNSTECPGHFASLKLCMPMFQYGFMKTVHSVMRCVCFHCQQLLTSTSEYAYRSAMLKKTPEERLREITKLCEGKSTCSVGASIDTHGWNLDEFKQQQQDAAGKTTGCEQSLPKIVRKPADNGSRAAFIADFSKHKNLDESIEKVQELSAKDIHNKLKNISDDTCRSIGLNPDYARPDWMVLTVLPVPPPAVRPSLMGSTRGEDDLTHKLANIAKSNERLKEKELEGSPPSVLADLINVLQFHVFTYIDNEIPGYPTDAHKSGRPIKALCQRLKGKEGRIRNNLMGKRVDFSARTVITPDPNISIDQVGVPRSIARNLTYPEIVTSFNIDRMHELVRNGRDEHPGANYIIDTDGTRRDLRYVKNRGDIRLAYGYRVERHIQDGDIIVFNRQPSLHKMSMMGHKVKIMPFSTFRLNLSVTSPYNADFDGDEMNMHVPQTLGARAEVMQLMMVPRQIISPQSNRPVIGIVQDTLLGSYLMTRRDTFIPKDVTMNMLMWVPSFDGRIPQPAILKPQQLWTGKQLFSLIVPPDINLAGKNNLYKSPKEGEYRPDDMIHPLDAFVTIHKGQLLSGSLDKKTLGASAGGLIHVIWMEKGHEVTQNFIDQCQGLINYWILQRGFTIGVGDIVADDVTRNEIRNIIDHAKSEVKILIGRIQEDAISRKPGLTVIETFENDVNAQLNEARDKSGDRAQTSLSFHNNIKTMVTGGSKGSNINISQMIACVGQQNVEGKRVSFGFLGRTLPHFTKDNHSPESRGFVENSYFTGLTPSEFFFHAMGGREGLIDTAVKTSETGYIQRRLVKAMEDVMVKYDGTVRNSLGDVVQFLYGEDGMDATYIEKQSFDSLLLSNRDLERRFLFNPHSDEFSNMVDESYRDDILNSEGDLLALQQEFEVITKDRYLLRNKILPAGKIDEPSWAVPVNLHRLIENSKSIHNIRLNNKSDLDPRYVIEQVKQLGERDLILIAGDDSISKTAQRNATLMFNILLRSNLASKRVIVEHKLNKRSFDWLIDVIRNRFQQAKVHPGEMIGAVAAQSIGEPATQMTLNTFHYAGVSSKNVTLGVPRLKEILNVARNIKTPKMDVFMAGNTGNDSDAVRRFQVELEHTTLKKLCAYSELWYDPQVTETVVESDVELLNTFYSLDDVLQYDVSRWMLRLEMVKEELLGKTISCAEIRSQIEQNLMGTVHCEYSNSINEERQVIRIRIRRDKDDDVSGPEAEIPLLKQIERILMGDKLTIRGVESIRKVFLSEKMQMYFDEVTGALNKRTIHFLETSGTDIQRVLNYDEVDSHLTSTNDICEVVEVLGIEAGRGALLNEINNVISFDGSYVNYRHLATLADIMTFRGHLMAINRHGINRVQSGALMRCSFEETVDILLNAAIFAQTDNLAGVTENIMLGQLAPLGTGAFELILNESMLAKAIIHTGNEGAKGRWSSAEYAGDEPGWHTPYSNTPLHMGADSPAPEFSHFSPGPMGSPDFMGSPSSPGYAASPSYPTSPAYASSPLYSPTSPSFLPTSPSYSASPNYSPTSPSYTPTSPSYSPTSPSYSPTSPAYSPTSPSYSPTSPAYSPTSPSYSPSSPSYSPTSPAYSPSSPSYSPTSPSYSPASPSYSPTSPSYSPTSPSYSPTSPSYSPASPSYSPTSPSYSPASPLYTIGSPSYSPSSPSYSPASPSYSPSYSAGSPTYSPSSPTYSPSSPIYSPSSPNYSPASPSLYSTKPEDEEEETK